MQFQNPKLLLWKSDSRLQEKKGTKKKQKFESSLDMSSIMIRGNTDLSPWPDLIHQR